MSRHKHPTRCEPVPDRRTAMTAALVVLLILGGAVGLLYMVSYNALVSAREQVADTRAVVASTP
jgi:hypothetical protein